MRSDEDLTTRARIRDAAVRLFGGEGFDATSVRAVAREAEVSPALVLHHFGSKDGLRHACDRYVIDELFDRKHELAHGDVAASIGRWLADIEQFQPMIDYLARMLTSASPAADELFDALLAGTSRMLDEQIAAGVVRAPTDRAVTALYVTAQGLAPLVVRHQLTRTLGVDPLSAEGVRRATIPLLELYTHGLYADDRLLRAARDAVARTGGPRSDKGENHPNQDPDPPQPSAS